MTFADDALKEECLQLCAAHSDDRRFDRDRMFPCVILKPVRAKDRQSFVARRAARIAASVTSRGTWFDAHRRNHRLCRIGCLLFNDDKRAAARLRCFSPVTLQCNRALTGDNLTHIGSGQIIYFRSVPTCSRCSGRWEHVAHGDCIAVIMD